MLFSDTDIYVSNTVKNLHSFSFRMCYVFAVHSDNELDGSKLAQLHHLLFVAVLTFVYCWPPF